jgi:hypothetical protein
MALIKRGDFNEFRGSIVDPSDGRHMFNIQPLSVLQEAYRESRGGQVHLDLSSGPRGLSLKTLTLDPGFDSFIAKVFSPKHHLYLMMWTYDLSGAPAEFYPGPGVSSDQCLIPLKSGDARRFLGTGILLRPARPVVGGLAVRMQVWESDAELRRFGAVMKNVAENVQASTLNKTLLLLAATTGVTLATLTAVKEASLELAKLIGGIMEKNSDDFVDFYEGYYPASEPWEPPDEQHAGYASQIVLTKFR